MTPDAETTTTEENRPMPDTKKRILVVEDERVVARDIQRSLVDLGYDVPTTAASAEQAIAMATERCPDLVLMDIRIKGDRDGIETASILRKQFDVPIVYLTAYADAPTVARARETEPFGYLLKPVKTNELRSAVEIALYKHDLEKRLRERERWLATTMRSIGDAIISTDASGLVTYLNPVAEALTGWKLEDARGRPSVDVLHLVDDRSRAAIEDPLRAALRDGRSLSIDGVLVRGEDGDRYISDSAAPITGEDGAVLGAVMVFRDVSERRQLQRQLELAERLATVGTMAAGVAHEVNNPLAFILANITVALESVRQRRGAPDDGADHRWMEDIESALVDAESGVSRVAKVVHDLNGFTRPGSIADDLVNLDEILEWSIEVAGRELQARAQVVRRFADTLRVSAPSARLGQVFVNLLINAAHALDAARRETNEVVVTTRTDAQGNAVVEIRDNGSGMTPEVMERAFEPFYTTKPVGQSAGLGLSVCHGIMSSLGGSIAFESEPGKGTLVRVTLPIDRSRVGGPAPIEPPPAPTTRGYLMLVDHEPLIRGALVRALGAQHAVTCPKTAREALALIIGGMRFDLILCDLTMPDLPGMDFYDAVLERDPDQARRIVFLTGGVLTARTVEFLRLVPNRHIGKPFQAAQLRRLVGDSVAELGAIPRNAVER